MKSRIKKINVKLSSKVLFGCLILSILSLQLFFFWNVYFDNEIEDYNNLNTSKTWTFSIPIYIDDNDPNYNWSKTAEENEWLDVNADGSSGNPYILANIILDAQGGSFDCLTIKNSEVFFKVENCNFFNTNPLRDYNGVTLINVINGTITANNCSYNGGDGISLENSVDNRITANIVHNNEVGIYMDQSSNNPIDDNDVYSNIYGMRLSGSHNNRIKYNDVYWNREGGIRIVGSNINTLTSNKIFENSDNYGLSLDNCHSNNITDNLIYRNNDRGLWLLNSGHNNIRNNTISESLYGFISNQGDYNIINNNTIENIGTSGMAITSSHYNNITENIINTTRSHGLYISNCDYSDIRGNIINNTSQYGISLYNSDESHIIGNSVENSGDTGILLTNCLNNDVIDNIVSNSKSFGMSLINSEIYTVAGNSLINCGYNIEGSLVLVSNLEMNTSNLVNGKPLHFYYNISGLTQINFPNTGQIILYSCDSASLSNMDFNNCSLGIALYYCESPTITGITSSYNNQGGVYLRECNNVQISANILSHNGGPGILLQEGNSSSILDNTINFNVQGIWVENQFNITIIDNDINDNIGWGIVINLCTFSTITENTVNNNYFGISLSGHNATISENIVSFNKYEGIGVGNCFDVLISGNTLNSNYESTQVGISLSGERITVTDNVVYNNHKALVLNGVSESRIETNEFSTDIVFQVHYIDVDYCSFVEFKNNNFKGIGVSVMIVRLIDSSNNIFISNNLLMGGFRLENSNNNQFLGNYIKDNGIAFDLEDSSYNTITNNTMINVMQCYRELGDCTANVFENNYCEESGRIPIPNIIGAIIGLCGVGIVTTVMLLKRRRINREYKGSET